MPPLSTSPPAQEADNSPTDRFALTADFDPRTLAPPEPFMVVEPPLTGDDFMVGQLAMQTPDARRPPLPEAGNSAPDSVVRMVQNFFSLKWFLRDGFSRPFLNNRQQDNLKVATARICSNGPGGGYCSFDEVIDSSRRPRRMSLLDPHEMEYLARRYWLTRLTLYGDESFGDDEERFLGQDA